MKWKWCVEVVLPYSSEVKTFVECLRYAGHIVEVIETDDKIKFQIQPPHGVLSEKWATMNAERMKTFGWKAVAVKSRYMERGK